MNMSNIWRERLLRAPQDEGAPSGDPPPVDNPPVSQPEADHSWVPEAFIKDGKPDLTGLRARFDELDAAEQARATQRPETADAYDLSVPEIDYKAMGLPDGFKVEIDTESEAAKPLWGEFKAVLHEAGFPSEATPKLMGLLAKYEATRAAEMTAAANAEMQKLGGNHTQRLADMGRALETRLSKDKAAAVMEAFSPTAEAVRALEELLRPTTFNVPPSEPAGADTSNLTPAQRLARANATAMQAQRRA